MVCFIHLWENNITLLSIIIKLKQLSVLLFKAITLICFPGWAVIVVWEHTFGLSIWQFLKKQTGKLSLGIIWGTLAWFHMWHFGTLVLARNLNYIYLWLKNEAIACWQHVWHHLPGTVLDSGLWPGLLLLFWHALGWCPNNFPHVTLLTVSITKGFR